MKKKSISEISQAILELETNGFAIINNYLSDAIEFVEEKFRSFDYKEIKRMKSNRAFELDKIVLENDEWAKDIWGEGELRYFLTK